MHGCGPRLACAYHLPSSPSAEGEQDLELELLDLSGAAAALAARRRVWLSPGATLEWLNALPGGRVGAMDSEGMVTVLSPGEAGGQWWVPLLLAGPRRARFGSAWFSSACIVEYCRVPNPPSRTNRFGSGHGVGRG